MLKIPQNRQFHTSVTVANKNKFLLASIRIITFFGLASLKEVGSKFNCLWLTSLIPEKLGPHVKHEWNRMWSLLTPFFSSLFFFFFTYSRLFSKDYILNVHLINLIYFCKYILILNSMAATAAWLKQVWKGGKNRKHVQCSNKYLIGTFHK